MGGIFEIRSSSPHGGPPLRTSLAAIEQWGRQTPTPLPVAWLRSAVTLVAVLEALDAPLAADYRRKKEHPV